MLKLSSVYRGPHWVENLGVDAGLTTSSATGCWIGQYLLFREFEKNIVPLFSQPDVLMYKFLDNFSSIGKDSFDQKSYIMGVFLLNKLNVFLGMPVKVNIALNCTCTWLLGGGVVTRLVVRDAQGEGCGAARARRTPSSSSSSSTWKKTAQEV